MTFDQHPSNSVHVSAITHHLARISRRVRPPMTDNPSMTALTEVPASPAPSPVDDHAERDLRRRTRLGYWLLVALVATVGVGKAVRSDVMDPDSFWHVRVAEQLLREGVHPIVDHLSYMSIKEPWTPYSWLAELLMKWSFDTGGYRLSLVFRAAMVAATVGFVGLACSAFAGTRRRMAAVVGVTWFSSASARARCGWSCRSPRSSSTST
jgi:hypothetical protein